LKAVLAAAIVAVLISATSATAAFVVTSANIKNGTIQTADISASAKRALKGNRGLLGPQGATGATGATGAPGLQGERGAQGERGLQGERGAQGERGLQGERGAQGEQGDPGPTGIATAARIRSTTQAVTGSNSYPGTLWPVSGNIWTQAAGETQILVGKVDVQYPENCDPIGTNTPGATVRLFIDGESAGSAWAYFYPGASGFTQTIGFNFYPVAALFGDSAEITHLMTARVADFCAADGQNFTFKNLHIDVIGVG
jgi:hypothetical protein